MSEILNNYFIFDNEIHNYNTRSASNIHLPRVGTGYGHMQELAFGITCLDLKTITSFSKFKAHLKLYLQIKSCAD